MEYFISLFSAVVAFGVGALALYREPKRSLAGVSFALGMTLLGVESLLASQSANSFLLPEVLVWQHWRLSVMALLPGIWLLFSLTYARGNAKESVTRWRGILLAASILPMGVVALAWGDLLSGEAWAGPNSMWMLSLSRSGVLLNILFTLGCILCLMNLEATLRESRGMMRWRVKYMIVGVGVLFVVRCYSSIQAVLYSSINVDLTGMKAGSLVIGAVFMTVALTRGPLSAVDLYPPYGIFCGSLTVIVAGIYLLLVGLLAEAAAYFEAGSFFPLQSFLMLVGMSAITLVLLSDRLRQRAKRFISHHLHRPQYDYRRVWSKFTERTAALTDQAEFCREVTRLISETLEVLSVTIWLVDDYRHSFALGGSTSISEEDGRALIGEGKLGSDLVRVLRAHAYPTAVLEVSGELGVVLQQLARKKFEKGGDYYFLTLSTHDEVLGVLIMGDRVSGLPFTMEEFDLIRTIGNQIVAILLSIKLSGRLGEAQKLEAFQTMSAFFVHDLKNTASTLSLMLQNLPKHFDDPDFRQDALRAIAKSVDKINALIVRLSYLRQKLDVKPVLMDLNAVVRNVLTGLANGAEAVTTELMTIPLVLLDSEQMQKVITNLILNAREAIGPGGRINIRTETRGNEVVMTLSDNGCGMTPEFLERSLFRPFQTTKQEGLGIGLFHCKMIVDAHRGKIEVESQKDIGTTFRVILPVPGDKK